VGAGLRAPERRQGVADRPGRARWAGQLRRAVGAWCPGLLAWHAAEGSTAGGSSRRGPAQRVPDHVRDRGAQRRRLGPSPGAVYPALQQLADEGLIGRGVGGLLLSLSRRCRYASSRSTRQARAA
jgi:hypothetical protein